MFLCSVADGVIRLTHFSVYHRSIHQADVSLFCGRPRNQGDAEAVDGGPAAGEQTGAAAAGWRQANPDLSPPGDAPRSAPVTSAQPGSGSLGVSLGRLRFTRAGCGPVLFATGRTSVLDSRTLAIYWLAARLGSIPVGHGAWLISEVQMANAL